MKKIKIQNKGFTLIETLIYVGIIGLVMVSFVSFSLVISSSRNKNYVFQEVQANARFALDIMAQKIKSARNVNAGTSVFGSDPGVLSLAMSDGAKNPTIIDLDQDDGILQITEGASAPVAIVSDKIKVTNLVFTSLSPGASRRNIRIEMTLEYNNPSDSKDFEYSQSFQTAVSLRH